MNINITSVGSPVTLLFRFLYVVISALVKVINAQIKQTIGFMIVVYFVNFYLQYYALIDEQAVTSFYEIRNF